MALFGERSKNNENGNGKKSKKKKPKEQTSNVKTVIEIKTVGDIPPIVEARQKISDGELNEAAIDGYRALKRDYIRYFRVDPQANASNRDFIIRTLKDLGYEAGENASVDNTAILDLFNGGKDVDSAIKSKYSALKKLATFYLDYYEKARFSENLHGDGEDIVDRMIDVYNYMDIMYLYFPETSTRKVKENDS